MRHARLTAGATGLFALTLTLALALALSGGEATAQDAAAAATPVETLDGAQDWHPFSRSTVRIYMADVKSLTVEGDITRVTIAKPPLQGAPGDYSHAREVVEFRCADKQSRSTTETEYGPDGAPGDRYEDPSPWDAYSDSSRDGFLAGIVCDGERAPAPTWPTIMAWVDAGRK